MSCLEEFQPFAIRSHFGIHGFLESDEWRKEVVELLVEAQTEAVVNLKLDGADFLIYVRRDSGIEVQASVLGLGELALEQRHLQRRASELAKLGGHTESWPQREHLHARFGEPANEQARKLCEAILLDLPAPIRVHVSLTGSFEWIRRLGASGKVVPCRECCPWHLTFGNPYPSASDVRLDLLLPIREFLFLRTGERHLSFSGFTWAWDSNESSANMLVWRVGKKNLATLDLWWDEPLPRGTLPRLEVAVQKFLQDIALL
ncbi:MAG: hypothetical protein QOH06_3716 [Acidobacteriota bacterium]|nr:hypothetical protein [Acidobacteriota bacterium]